MLSYAIMPTEKVQSDRVDNRCQLQWPIFNGAYKGCGSKNGQITLVNTKVYCNIASIYGNGATKMS